jgi:deazaflavin-dependent oxidoreductase (nitroreductase family)
MVNEKLNLYWWQRFIQWLSAMRWAARFMTNRLHRWDRWVNRLSNGRWTATEFLVGLPVIFITSIGAKTGQKRITPLLAIREGEDYILAATKFGAGEHPQWYFNMKANPRVEVVYKHRQLPYRVTELVGEPRRRAWEHAVAFYPGYQAYEDYAIQREIPVLRLSPLDPAASS